MSIERPNQPQPKQTQLETLIEQRIYLATQMARGETFRDEMTLQGLDAEIAALEAAANENNDGTSK